MTLHTFRRIAGFYVFLVVFSVAPAAQQKHVPAETTRLIDVLKLGTNGTVADVGSCVRILDIARDWPDGLFLVLAERPQ
jgi:hypothetical protein